jgi:hypothetical protein
LRYYFYNYACPEIKPNELGVVLMWWNRENIFLITNLWKIINQLQHNYLNMIS